MSDITSQIVSVIGNAPKDLVDFYQSCELPRYDNPDVNFLQFEEAKAFSQQIQSYSLIGKLGLWALDDANDSNPFCYISGGPCAGAILHVFHDDKSVIAYSSMASYLKAMQEVGESDMFLYEVEPEPNLSFNCDSEIADLCNEGSDDATFLISIYLPVCADLSLETKNILVAHDDFFVREEIAQYLCLHPQAADLQFAQRLAADRLSQVATHGKLACEAIKRIINSEGER